MTALDALLALQEAGNFIWTFQKDGATKIALSVPVDRSSPLGGAIAANREEIIRLLGTTDDATVLYHRLMRGLELLRHQEQTGPDAMYGKMLYTFERMDLQYQRLCRERAAA